MYVVGLLKYNYICQKVYCNDCILSVAGIRRLNASLNLICKSVESMLEIRIYTTTMFDPLLSVYSQYRRALVITAYAIWRYIITQLHFCSDVMYYIRQTKHCLFSSQYTPDIYTAAVHLFHLAVRSIMIRCVPYAGQTVVSLKCLYVINKLSLLCF